MKNDKTLRSFSEAWKEISEGQWVIFDHYLPCATVDPALHGVVDEYRKHYYR